MSGTVTVSDEVLMVAPDMATLITSGAAEDEYKRPWSFKVHALHMSSYWDKGMDAERAAQRLPLRLTLNGNVHLQTSTGGGSFQLYQGEFATEIPYELLDSLIAALQKARDEIPGIVAAEYVKYDEQNDRDSAYNNRKRNR